MKSKTWKIKQNGRDKIFGLLVNVLILIFFIVEIYPIIFVLSASVSDPHAVNSGRMLLLPIDPTLDGYRYILQYREIWTGYVNTIFYTLWGTLINLAVTLPAAYVLSRQDFKDKGFFTVLFMITMYFSGGLIPTYLNIRELGLLNTRTVMLVCSALSVYNMIVAKTFFGNSIPWELHESAKIDGANNFTMFFRIVLPLSSPIIVVMALYYGVGHWNSYFNAMIYLARKRETWPLQLFLREILLQSKAAEQALSNGFYSIEQMEAMMRQADTANMVKYCVIVVATAPMLIIYPWLQKYFAKGVMIGAVKG